MDRLRALRYFVKLAHSLNFGETADHFGVPSSSVSRRIKDLESNLGIALFIRTTRSVNLTDLGALYLEQVSQALQIIDSADEMLLAQSVSPSGSVRITAMPSFAELFVLPALDRLRKNYPNIQYDLHITDELLNLSSNEADIAIRAGSVLPDQLVARRLGEHKFITVGAPAYFDHIPVPCLAAEIKNHPILMYRGPKAVLHWQLYQNGDWKDMNLRPQFVTNHGPSLLEAVLKGQGLALMPYWAVQEHLKAGLLQEIMIEDGVLSVTRDRDTAMHLLYHPPKFRLQKIQLTIDFLLEELKF